MPADIFDKVPLGTLAFWLNSQELKFHFWKFCCIKVLTNSVYGYIIKIQIPKMEINI